MLDCGANECRKLIITFHQVNNSSFLLEFWIRGLYDQATQLATATYRWEACQEELGMIPTYYLYYIIFIFWPRSHYGICIVTTLPYVPHHQLIRGLILINSSAYSLPWLLSDGLMDGCCLWQGNVWKLGAHYRQWIRENKVLSVANWQVWTFKLTRQVFAKSFSLSSHRSYYSVGRLLELLTTDDLA